MTRKKTKSRALQALTLELSVAHLQLATLKERYKARPMSDESRGEYLAIIEARQARIIDLERRIKQQAEKDASK